MQSQQQQPEKYSFEWKVFLETLDLKSYVLKRVPPELALEKLMKLLPSGVNLQKQVRNNGDNTTTTFIARFSSFEQAKKMPTQLKVDDKTEKLIYCSPRVIRKQPILQLNELEQLSLKDSPNRKLAFSARLPNHYRVSLFKLVDLGGESPHFVQTDSSNQKTLLLWTKSASAIPTILHLIEKQGKEDNQRLATQSRQKHSYTTTKTGRVLLPHNVHPYRAPPVSNPPSIKRKFVTPPSGIPLWTSGQPFRRPDKHRQRLFWKKQEKIFERVLWKRECHRRKIVEPVWHSRRKDRRHIKELSRIDRTEVIHHHQRSSPAPGDLKQSELRTSKRAKPKVPKDKYAVFVSILFGRNYVRVIYYI